MRLLELTVQLLLLNSFRVLLLCIVGAFHGKSGIVLVVEFFFIIRMNYIMVSD